MSTAPSRRKSTSKPLYEPVLELPPLPPDQYEGLRSSIALNGVLVPILVDSDGPVRRIIDGNHRRKIADELGVECPEIVRKGLSEQELRSLARALNLARRQLSQEQRRQLIADQLRETPRRSDRWVARQLGVHHATVGSVRAAMEGTGQIIQCDSRIGADDRCQPAHRLPLTNGKPAPEIATVPIRPLSAPSVDLDEEPEPADPLADVDEEAILKRAKEIRQRRIAEWRERQKAQEENARKKLTGKRTWKITADQRVVRCHLLIADPPYGITREPWEPADIESFTRHWCRRWSSCGADFLAIFWSQLRLFEGRKWFDESLQGYDFQQLLTWHAPNYNAHNSRLRMKETWEPIFLYRRVSCERLVFTKDKPWGDGLSNHDCHVAPVPESNYKDVEMKCHPCQKPLSVMRWLIYALSEPGEMVASPFAGVAPCGVAATQLGRRYHGIEIDEGYRRIAEGRIAMYGVDRR